MQHCKESHYWKLIKGLLIAVGKVAWTQYLLYLPTSRKKPLVLELDRYFGSIRRAE